jgi:hypothetical protein
LREELPGFLRNPVAAGIAVDVRMWSVEGANLGGIAILAPGEVNANMGA